MREITITKIVDTLNQKGFLVSTYLHSNNCFDLAAKKAGQLFLIKVFENIDATRPEQATELKKLSTALNATAIIIGEKTKTSPLTDSLVYDRHGINCISINSFKAFLNHDNPKAWYFKGKTIVELDSEKLKKTRVSKGFSLSELARRVDSTPKSVFGYEKGAHSSLHNAQKLEHELAVPLIKKVDLTKKMGEEVFENNSSDPVFEKITRLGLDLAFFYHAPFQAFGHPKESLMISIAEHKRDIAKKSAVLNKTKKIVKADSVIIAKHYNKKNVHHTAVIEEEELESFSKKKDFIQTIKEREK